MRTDLTYEGIATPEALSYCHFFQHDENRPDLRRDCDRDVISHGGYKAFYENRPDLRRDCDIRDVRKRAIAAMYENRPDLRRDCDSGCIR